MYYESLKRVHFCIIDKVSISELYFYMIMAGVVAFSFLINSKGESTYSIACLMIPCKYDLTILIIKT